MSDKKAEAWLAEHSGIDSIFACVSDLNGVMRGKRIPMGQLSKVVNGDVRMPLSIVNVDVWGEDIKDSALVFETGDAVGRLVQVIGISGRWV